MAGSGAEVGEEAAGEEAGGNRGSRLGLRKERRLWGSGLGRQVEPGIDPTAFIIFSLVQVYFELKSIWIVEESNQSANSLIKKIF